MEFTTVIICGGGPTGTLLSVLLGQLNVPNVVLERETEITTDPRGIALDEDGIRMIQAIGMYAALHTEISTKAHTFMFLSGTEPNLHQKPFLVHDYKSSGGNTGHVGFVFHKQPALEKAIRDALAGCTASRLNSGCTVNSIDEAEDVVIIEYTDPEGEKKRLQGKFLVGADGKRGYVRKKHLEPKGIWMERAEGTNYGETWIALNWHIRPPTPDTHPDFPLWKLGYSPEDVYDAFFPNDFRFICNPSRPSVCGRFGLPDDRLWRFEFVVRSGEDPQTMASPAEVENIVFPYLTHPGRRYAREEAVFPPFGGQGIVSGFRDVSALAWRLALVHRNPRADHVEILRAWHVERKQQLEASLATTIRNGELVTNGDPFKAFVRD